jgi:hypothetical protein
MIIGDMHPGTAAGLAQSRRERLWAIGLSAVLVATGLARRPANPNSRRRRSRRVGRRARPVCGTAIGDPGAGMEVHPSARL